MTGHLFTQAINESRGSARSLANAIARVEAMNDAWGGMLDHGLEGGPAYDFHRDRFNALRETTRDQALSQQNAA